jgi:NADH-ubiquinone oxidoreductase chain 2
LYSRVTIYSLIYCLYITFLNFYIREGISLFGGLFHDTKITKVFQVFLLLISGIILNLTSFYSRKIKRAELGVDRQNLAGLDNKVWSMIINKMAEHFTIIEYSLIIVFIIVGALLLMSSSDLVSIFLSIELQSYGLYLISTIYKNSELATRAGLTYFLLGGLSSCFILLGSSLLYANSGITNLDGIYLATNISNICNDITYLYKADYINYSLIILSVGFLFKVSAAPFHF